MDKVVLHLRRTLGSWTQLCYGGGTLHRYFSESEDEEEEEGSRIDEKFSYETANE